MMHIKIALNKLLGFISHLLSAKSTYIRIADLKCRPSCSKCFCSEIRNLLCLFSHLCDVLQLGPPPTLCIHYLKLQEMQHREMSVEGKHLHSLVGGVTGHKAALSSKTDRLIRNEGDIYSYSLPRVCAQICITGE